MKGWQGRQILLAAVVVIGLAGACLGRPAAVQSPQAPLPTRTALAAPSTPSPTFTSRPTLAPVASAMTSTPDSLPNDWIEHEDQSIRISLPRDWQVVDLTSSNVQLAFADLKQKHPQMADIIGSPDVMLSATLWALGPAGNALADNLNIRRAPLGAERITDMQGQVLDLLLKQLSVAGFTELSSDASLRIDGLPAARISYTLPLSTEDEAAPTIRGHQYLVLSDSDLWLLSYSTTPEREAEMAPIFEQSARSFQLR